MMGTEEAEGEEWRPAVKASHVLVLWGAFCNAYAVPSTRLRKAEALAGHMATLSDPLGVFRRDQKHL
jgi:hypothetical protein